MDNASYAELDRRNLWHPYTRFSAIEAGALPLIAKAEGPYLYDNEGRRFFDAVSSWWACALGHGHPRIVAAIQRQAAELQHSILGNLSHRPAVELAAKLADLMPTPDRHTLFSSDGASAVEAALKIALQYRHNRGEPERHLFLSLHDAYHGDTLGAVAIGYLDAFHRPFKSLVSPACRVSPEDGIEALERVFHNHGRELTAAIVEPLCQGAAGMRMYSAAYLTRMMELCREFDVLMIVDEIATGFGRTGRFFAFEYAGIDPDIVCVGKALSAGYLPISAAIVRDNIYETFSDLPVDRSFYHGHTFAGNPIAAAAALQTLEIYREENICKLAVELGEELRDALMPLSELPGVRDARFLGAIAAIELRDSDRNPPLPMLIRKRLFEQNILLRPLGNVIYLMPPLNTPLDLAREAAMTVRKTIEQVL